MRQLNFLDELIIDNFAGGGGASCGIELATGRPVDIAINHDPDAIAMHKANHPYTRHYQESVWDIDPKEICQGHKVGLAWFSPDCKHFSKAKGGKPVDKNIRGLDKFVIKEEKPFIIPIGYGERKGQKPRLQDIDKPLTTIVSSCKQYLVTPALIQYHSETAKSEVRGQRLNQPLFTVDSTPRYALFTPFFSTLKFKNSADSIVSPLTTITSVNCHYLISPYLSKYFGGVVGSKIDKPLPTVTAIDHNSLTMPYLTQYYGGADHANSVLNPLQTVTVKPRHFLCESYLTILRKNMDCKAINEPLPTITAHANHFAKTDVYLREYDSKNLGRWNEIRELLNTYTDWNISANQVLIFCINGVEYFISDIGLRMLQPKELYKAQGFPDDYIIDKDCNGKEYNKTKQVARCGNAVPPPFSKALVMANCKWLCDKSCNNMKEFNAVAG